ncbi:hypothetical protein QNH14_02755 [Apirhabdus apintestini]|uniref:hypothetical protein n=1 Tax=Erwinia sp. HR93 TaxID=3094840 RepID=UPI002ADEC6A0|nr:hypothetical protein [Erwinia sp. HR93]MEA1063465.1 hypothetical protein [Erwinia sp. HR93]WPM85292.1 hypothetical protein QNH14_02755 [Enterobacteriaceae bacterium CA-0114]
MYIQVSGILTLHHQGHCYGSVWEDSMLTVYNTTKAAVVDTHVDQANAKNGPAAVTSAPSVKSALANALRPNNSSQCAVLNNLHIPQGTSATDIERYCTGLQTRINLEYKPQGSTVFLLGTPEIVETNESLSLPISPHILTQKLLSLSNQKTCKFVIKSNGYV